jgi:hypothetical protein
MRKIYQSVPDVPPAIANKAIDIIKRHLAASGVRRTNELSEESRIHLYRELRSFFQTDLPPLVFDKNGDVIYAWGLCERRGLIGSIFRRLKRFFNPPDAQR